MKTINEIKDAARKPEDFNLNHRWVVKNTETGTYIQSECSEFAANWAARVHNEHAARFDRPLTFITEEVALGELV